jgi:hypothetical protein
MRSRQVWCRTPGARVAALLCCLVAGAAAAAEAAPSGPIDWTFGGFGTVGLAHSSERQADYTANVLNPGAAGYTDRYSAAVDSRLGVQLGAHIGRDWSAVLQVVSEHNLQQDYRPTVEWANVQYQATPELSLRLGRIALPTYLAADYRKVGYTLQWIRPPVEVYGALPVSNSDGIDASYRAEFGRVANLTQVFVGRARVKTGDTGHATAQGLTGLSNTTSVGALTLRASIMTAHLTVDLVRPLAQALRQFGPQGVALADQYDLERKRVLVGALGLSYDPGDWFLMSEISRLDARSFLGDKTAMYATAGVRLGAVAPYLTYAKVRSNDATRVAGIDMTSLPPAAAAGAAYVNGALNGLLSTIAVQHTVSTGARWDFAKDYALKLQYDRVLPQGGTSGTLISVQPGFVSGRPLHVISATLDFVF